jgi:gliding motility-associated lipoprotein GldH
MRIASIVISCLVLLCLTSCDSKMVFEESRPIADHVWKVNQPVKLEFEVKDTMAFHNFYITVRNGEDYEYSNMFVFVEMEFPNGKKSTDTVECVLADPTGKWYGDGVGSIYSNRILYKADRRFPLSGRYKVNIHQGMREEDLKGVYDVGFRLALSR